MYNEDGETCYMLAVPGSGVTVLNLNHEINLFGSCTNVYTTEVLCYPSIQDEPTQLKVEKDDGWVGNLLKGVFVTTVFAGLAVATVFSGGAVLAAVALAGAAVGTAAVTAGATYSDIKSGHSRSIDEFAFQLANGAAIGATSAALVGEIVMILPAASAAAGVEASMIAGISELVTVGGSGVAAANVMFGLNEAFAVGSGTNVMLETVFDGDVEAYDTAAMMISMLGFAIIQYGISNIALAPNKNKSSKNGVNLETKSESGSNSANKIGNSDKVMHSYTRDEIINSLDGVTQKSTEIANSIQNGKIKINVLGDELFESYLGCSSDTTAMQVGNQIYVRSSSATLLSDVVHEGVHAMDFINGVDESVISSWSGETSAYNAERLFQLESGMQVQFESEEDMMVHIWSNYKK